LSAANAAAPGRSPSSKADVKSERRETGIMANLHRNDIFIL